MSLQNVIPPCSESREKVLEPPDRGEGMEAEGSTSSNSAVNPPIILHLKENKTKQYPTVPTHLDTRSGRLQLMLYRRLLSQLVATSPLYDFNPVWKKLGINSSSRLPTKFLVQANLISDNSDFQPTTLGDLVSMWHEFVVEANIQGVNENLELVYRLRPPPYKKQKSKANTANPPKHLPPYLVDTFENNTAGPLVQMEDSTTFSEEEARSSIMPLADQEGGFPRGE
jgi:Exonuclease V - a 5' deoxyribonuclease